VGAGLGAAVAGLLGSPAGLLFVVGGVWTVRSAWRSGIGFAWGVACMTSAIRWGTTSLADIQAATRSFGPTIAVGPRMAAAGAAAAFAGAMLDEARTAGLVSRRPAERAAAGLALLALVAAFVAPGPGAGGTAISLSIWVGLSFGLAALLIAGAGTAARLPGWVPPVLALGGGVAVALAA
jgi:hypothetical protein